MSADDFHNFWLKNPSSKTLQEACSGFPKVTWNSLSCFRKLPVILKIDLTSPGHGCTINILLFLKCGILEFYAGKSHNLIGQEIFRGDQDFLDQKSWDLYEKSRDLSNYEIFKHKILKSQSFKKRAIYWYFYATLNIFSQLKLF